MDALSLGWAHFWKAGDAVTHGVAWLLLAMSVASWYVILSKGWSTWRIRRAGRHAVPAFWAAGGTDGAMNALRAADPEDVFARLAARARRATAAATTDGAPERSDWITRALRQELGRTTARLESGLTFLASVGSTAPFVGLLGTVWSIYHALVRIAGAGNAMIDQIAGPVGEALIMTAAGLAVAIPAVLAYNAFTRANRVTTAELDAFAHDLLAMATSGRRLDGDAPGAAGAS
jgi:biopolymer transport protein ExbB